jgi:hypothetical protein
VRHSQLFGLIKKRAGEAPALPVSLYWLNTYGKNIICDFTQFSSLFIQSIYAVFSFSADFGGREIRRSGCCCSCFFKSAASARRSYPNLSAYSWRMRRTSSTIGSVCIFALADEKTHKFDIFSMMAGTYFELGASSIYLPKAFLASSFL